MMDAQQPGATAEQMRDELFRSCMALGFEAKDRESIVAVKQMMQRLESIDREWCEQSFGYRLLRAELEPELRIVDGGVSAFAYSADGSQLAVALERDGVRLLGAGGAEVVWPGVLREGRTVVCLAFSPGGTLMAAATNFREGIQLIDVEAQWSLDAAEHWGPADERQTVSQVVQLIWSGDGSVLFAVRADGAIRRFEVNPANACWAVESGTRFRRSNMPTAGTWTAAQQSQWQADCDAWNAQRATRRLFVSHKDLIEPRNERSVIGECTDRRTLAWADARGVVTVYDLLEERVTQTFETHQATPRSIAFDPVEKRLALVTQGGSVVVFTVSDSTAQASKPWGKEATCVAWANAADGWMAIGFEGGTVAVKDWEPSDAHWRVASGGAVAQLWHYGDIKRICFRPNSWAFAASARIASRRGHLDREPPSSADERFDWGKFGGLRVWNIFVGFWAQRLRWFNDEQPQFAFTADSQAMIFSAYPRVAKSDHQPQRLALVDILSGLEVAGILTGLRFPSGDWCLSHDGKSVIMESLGEDHQLSEWRFETTEELSPYYRTKTRGRFVGMSANAQWVAVVADGSASERKLCIEEVATSHVVALLDLDKLHQSYEAAERAKKSAKATQQGIEWGMCEAELIDYVERTGAQEEDGLLPQRILRAIPSPDGRWVCVVFEGDYGDGHMMVIDVLRNSAVLSWYSENAQLLPVFHPSSESVLFPFADPGCFGLLRLNEATQQSRLRIDDAHRFNVGLRFINQFRRDCSDWKMHAAFSARVHNVFAISPDMNTLVMASDATPWWGDSSPVNRREPWTVRGESSRDDGTWLQFRHAVPFKDRFPAMRARAEVAREVHAALLSDLQSAGADLAKLHAIRKRVLEDPSFKGDRRLEARILIRTAQVRAERQLPSGGSNR